MESAPAPAPALYWDASEHKSLREKALAYMKQHPKPRHTPDPARAQENILRDPRARKPRKSSR